MVNIIKRMRNLRELLWIRVGPGALVLPKEVTKLSLEFNKKIYGGNWGARKFWREMLPRIKYRNPSIPIQVSRHDDAEGPCLLHLYTASTSSQPATSATSTSTPPSGTPNVRNTLTPDTTPPTHTIDMRAKTESEILDLLLQKVPDAKVVPATSKELEEMEEIRAARVVQEQDRIRERDRLMRERREAELLRLARGEISAAAA